MKLFDLRTTTLAVALAATLGSPAAADTIAIEKHGAAELAPPVSEQARFSASGLFLAATLAETERDLPRAAEFYRQLHELDPTSARFLQSAFTMELADGRMPGALDLATLLVASGDTGISRLTNAVEAIRQRSYRVALRELEAYQTDGFGEFVSTLIAAWTLHGAGETKRGLIALDALDGPAWVELYAAYHAGLIRLAAGEAEAALEDMERAYSTDGGAALRLVQGYAAALLANDLTDEAIEVMEIFRGAAPSNAMIIADLDAVEKGEPTTLRISTPQQGVAEVLYGLGLAIGQDGADEVGSIYLNLALHAEPTSDMARFALARTYEGLSLWERAVEVYEGMSEGHPLKRTAEICLGVLLDQLERPEEADEHLLALIESDPSDLDAIATLGTLLRVRRDFAMAADVYTQGIETITEPLPEHWRLFYQRGIAYERTDRWPLAEADFLKALELNEDQPDVMNYLAYTWVDRGENLDRSVEMLQRAVEMRPESGYIVDSLGWVYFRLGRFEEAVEQLERAVILDPTQAVIHDHLGDAYWMVGRRLEARFQWSHARDLDDDLDEIDDDVIQRKLQRGLTRDEVESVGVWPEGYVIPNTN
ncbi:MAG: tetratricopeptide repeat protein [Pseudomonadota bacterium]